MLFPFVVCRTTRTHVIVHFPMFWIDRGLKPISGLGTIQNWRKDPRKPSPGVDTRDG